MTYKGARIVALTAYRKAVKAAEADDWAEAIRLTEVGGNCAFCQVLLEDFPNSLLQRNKESCPTCPAVEICKEYPDDIAVRNWGARALSDLRKVVAELEALEIK